MYLLDKFDKNGQILPRPPSVKHLLLHIGRIYCYFDGRVFYINDDRTQLIISTFDGIILNFLDLQHDFVGVEFRVQIVSGYICCIPIIGSSIAVFDYNTGARLGTIEHSMHNIHTLISVEYINENYESICLIHNQGLVRISQYGNILKKRAEFTRNGSSKFVNGISAQLQASGVNKTILILYTNTLYCYSLNLDLLWKLATGLNLSKLISYRSDKEGKTMVVIPADKGKYSRYELLEPKF
jgi:hypothetical protein